MMGEVPLGKSVRSVQVEDGITCGWVLIAENPVLFVRHDNFRFHAQSPIPSFDANVATKWGNAWKRRIRCLQFGAHIVETQIDPHIRMNPGIEDQFGARIPRVSLSVVGNAKTIFFFVGDVEKNVVSKVVVKEVGLCAYPIGYVPY
jgi:hypothetical protein